MLSQQKIEKIVHFFEHQYFMNQCMFFADFLVKCYPLDTQKPKPKFFDNSYIFHNGHHLDLHKKKKKWIKCIVSFLEKTKTGSGLASSIEELIWPENFKLIPCLHPEILMFK